MSLRRDPLLEAQIASGTRLRKGDASRANAYRMGVLHQDPTKVSDRWAHAVGRCRRILEGLGRSSDVTKSIKGAEYPELARELVELWQQFFMDRFRPPPTKSTDHNPFRGLSDRDASRKFMRLVEDVCDRSTGKLGSWYAGVSVTRAARNK